MKHQLGSYEVNIAIGILFVLFILANSAVSPAVAEDLGCFEIGQTVPLPPHFINSSGASTAATNKEAKIYRGATTEATIADSSFTQRDAVNRPGAYLINWDSTGKTAGRYNVTYRGTLDGSAKDGGDDQFELATACPLKATAAGRSLDVSATGDADSQVVGMNAGTITASAMAEITGSVVSSADCTNSNTVFDTTLSITTADKYKDALLVFTSGALNQNVKQIDTTAINGCVTVKGGFNATPAAGDAFMIQNK